MWRKGNFYALQMRKQTGAVTMKKNMEFPLEMENTYDSAIPLLGIYPKKITALTQKGICTSMFTAALLTIANL